MEIGVQALADLLQDQDRRPVRGKDLPRHWLPAAGAPDPFLRPADLFPGHKNPEPPPGGGALTGHLGKGVPTGRRLLLKAAGAAPENRFCAFPLQADCPRPAAPGAGYGDPAGGGKGMVGQVLAPSFHTGTPYLKNRSVCGILEQNTEGSVVTWTKT